MHQSFEEDKLFEEIVSLSHPEIANFVELYIEGKKALPFRELAAHIDMKYREEYVEEAGTFGRFSVFPDYKKGQIRFRNVRQNELNIFNGDVLLSIDNTPIKTSNINDFLSHLYDPPPNTLTQLVVLRNGTRIKLKGKAAPFFRRHRHWWGEDVEALKDEKMLKIFTKANSNSTTN